MAIEFELLAQEAAVLCRATAETVGPTGVEMEVLTAVNAALLTIYDMCKAADRGMVISDIRLLEKHGGKSGSFVAPSAAAEAESFRPGTGLASGSGPTPA